jgi:hypothetical protein
MFSVCRPRLFALLSVLLALAGCSSSRDTFPPRSATEQLLLSTAADRAVERLQVHWMRGKAIYVDDSHLEAYDKPYVVERVRKEVLKNGGRLVEDRAQAAVVLQVASGALSVDTGDFLIGLPQITIPIPFGGQGLTLPEVAIFKIQSRVGKAKLLFNALDATTGAQVAPLPLAYGTAMRRFWWLLMAGPFDASDTPRELE